MDSRSEFRGRTATAQACRARKCESCRIRYHAAHFRARQDPSPRASSCRSSRSPADDRECESGQSDFRRRQPDPGTRPPTDPPTAFAESERVPSCPRVKRRIASARVAFHRQRAPNIGASSIACVRTSRTVAWTSGTQTQAPVETHGDRSAKSRFRCRWPQPAVRS